MLKVLIVILLPITSFSQKEVKDYCLKKVLKQNNFQYQFSVLDGDKKGVSFFDKRKMYFWYKSQTVHSTQGGSSGELLHGGFSMFYASKQLYSKGVFSKGLKVGEWKYWRENGSLEKVERWLRGRLLAVRMYSKNGNLKKELKYRGSVSISSEKDSIVIINSKKKKRTERTFKDNKLIKQESFLNGVIHGRQLVYLNGKLVSKKKYKMGKEVPKKEKSSQKRKDNKEQKGRDKQKTKNNKCGKPK